MTFSILVPTFHRPADLRRCLSALSAQTLGQSQIIVIMRDGDEETKAVLCEWPDVEVVTVNMPGVVAAMNVGLAAARGEIIALTDDDAAPHPDWLEKIAAHFATDARLGGVGGRDWIHYEDGTEEQGTHPDVGRVQWHGRVIGNHHLGVGAPRAVNLLKGVNCAYRAKALKAIGFDTRLRGVGAQVHWELALGLALERAGWKLLYDPSVGVEHFPAARADADSLHRGRFQAAALENMVYNESVVLGAHFPLVRRLAYWTWAALVGTRDVPGLLQGVRLALQRQPHLRERLLAVLRGRRAGLRDCRWPR